MTGQGHFHSAADILTFVTAGDATITLKSLKSGDHLTYRVTKADDEKVTFVSLLTDGDKYTYIGLLDDAGVRLTRKSRLTADSRPIRAFGYFWKNVRGGRIAPDLEVRHEGRCGRCHRPLTVPASLDRGIGPDCAARMGLICE